MSVYIKGMEMPRTCLYCAFALDGWCHATGNDTDMITLYDRPEFCPLVFVHDHGRLIDADAVDTTYSDPEVIETLDGAPTIIPADKETPE